MSSPALISPAAMAGDWWLVHKGEAICPIRFEARPAGEGYVLRADAACLAAIGLGGVSLWRPSNDGIGFADLSGEIFAFFVRETPARFRWPAVGVAQIVLERR